MICDRRCAAAAVLCYKSFTARQGLPIARQPGGISWVTTLPAPITESRPIVTPGRTITPPPIQTFSPMLIGRAYVWKKGRGMDGCHPSTSRSPAFTGWAAVYSCTLEAISVLSPITILLQSIKVQLILIMMLSPKNMFLP